MVSAFSNMLDRVGLNAMDRSAEVLYSHGPRRWARLVVYRRAVWSVLPKEGQFLDCRRPQKLDGSFLRRRSRPLPLIHEVFSGHGNCLPASVSDIFSRITHLSVSRESQKHSATPSRDSVRHPLRQPSDHISSEDTFAV